MLKNKIKLVLAIILAIVLVFAPFVHADLEEDLEAAGISTQSAEYEDELDNEQENDVEDEDIDDEQENDVEDEDIDDEQEDLEDEEDNEQIIKGDQYIVGDKIELNDSIDGNVYILASEVTINCRILGNVFVCANTIKIADDGNISNSLYAAASDIQIVGEVYDLYSTSRNINITGYVCRDVHIACENFILYGSIERDASIVAKNFSFEKMEEGIVEETGIIYGNLNYSSENEVNIPEGVVEGNIKFDKSLETNYKPNYIFMAISWIALIILVWLILKKVSPEFEKSAALLLKEKSLKTFGVGLLSFIAVPLIAVLLMILVVTAKAGILLLFTYILLAILGETIFIIALNNLLADKFNIETTAKKLLVLIITAIVAWGLAMIPVAGAVFALIYTVTGFGIIITKLLGKKETTNE